MPKFLSDGHFVGSSTDLAIDGNITGTGNLTLTHGSTPFLQVIDSTNDVDLKIKAANSYGYIELDNDNDANSSRLIIKVDGGSVHEYLAIGQIAHVDGTYTIRRTHASNQVSLDLSTRKDHDGSGNFTAGDDVARLNFKARDSVVTSDLTVGSIITEADNTFTSSDQKARMKFQLRTGSSNENVLFLDSDKSATFYGNILISGNTAITSGRNFYGTIFYDADNTAYYVDPASTSALNSATFAGNISLGDAKELIFGAATDFKIYHNNTTNVNHVSSKLDRQLSLNANIIQLTNQANNSTYLLLNSTGATFSGIINAPNGSNTHPAYNFASHDGNGMYLEDYDASANKEQVSIAADGVRRLRVNEAGVWSDFNVYFAGSLRKFGEWQATSGTAGQGFKFENTADSTTPLTLTSGGNATFAGTITSTGVTISNQNPVITFTDSSGSSYSWQNRFRDNVYEFLWGGGVKYYFKAGHELRFGDRDAGQLTNEAIKDPFIRKSGSTTINSVAIGHLQLGTNNTTQLTIGATGNVTLSNQLYIPQYVYHADDTNTYFGFGGTDYFNVVTGGSNAIIAHDNGAVYLYHSGTQMFQTMSTGVSVSGSQELRGTASTTANNPKTEFAGFITVPGPETSRYTHLTGVSENKLGGLYRKGSGAGYSLVSTKDGSTITSNWLENAFQANDNFSSLSSTTSSTVCIITITVPTMFHGSNAGIAFSNTAWRAKDVKIEVYNGTSWSTIYDVTNSDRSVHINYFSKGSTGVTQLKYTLTNFATTSCRITSIFANNYTGGNGVNAQLYDDNILYGDQSIQTGYTLSIPSYVYHLDDTNTYFGFENNDQYRIVIGGAEGIHINSSRIRTNKNIEPSVDSTYDIGTSSVRFANIYADTLYGDGSNLTNLPTGSTTTINNNADNRVITGSGTADTLEAESGLTFDGDILEITGSGTTTKRMKVSPGTDYGRAHIGRAALGKLGFDDHAGFAHEDHNSQTNYALLQNEAGKTFLNSASGQETNFRINNSTVGKYNSGAIYFPLYYDIDNTSYWVNPAGSHAANLAGRVDITTASDVKMRFKTPSTDSSDWGYIEFYKRDGNRATYFGINGSGNPVWAVNDGGPYIQLIDSGDYVEVGATNLRASSFVDKDNTSYYIDPANTGTAVNLAGEAHISGKIGINTTDPDGQGYSYAEDLVILGGNSASDGVGITLRGNGKTYGVIAFGDNADDNAGEIYYAHNNDTMSFRAATGVQLVLTSTTINGQDNQFKTTNANGFRIDSSSYARIEIDSNDSWSYIRFQDNGSTTWDFATLDGGNLEIRPGGGGSNRTYFDSSGNSYSETSKRAPIFYDSNDTTYYLDPANTGTALKLAGNASVGGDINASTISCDGNKILDMPNNSTQRGAWNPIATFVRGSGTAVYGDEDFVSGSNNVYVYNNQGGTGVQHFREEDGTTLNQIAPNSSGYVIRVVNNGNNTSPGRGGFYQTISSSNNQTFVQVFQAKLETGKSFQIAENSQGTNKTSYWLSNNHGTGKFEWYVRVSHCGDSGTFSSGGHVYVNGGSANEVFTWYLASSEIYKVTDAQNRRIRSYIATSSMIAPVYYGSNTTYYGDFDSTGTSLNIAGAIELIDSKAIRWGGNNILSHNGTQTYIGDNSSSSAVTVTGTNMTVAGDLTVSGGDITLSGTGRIQGVDTVSAGTDAVNKNYVDNNFASADTTYSFNFGTQLTANTWTDTGIDGGDMLTGTYIMQVEVTDHNLGGGHYTEYYSGVISWMGGATNSTMHDEIPVHRAGHAPNNGDIQFRTLRASGSDTHDLMLQVKHNQTYSGAPDQTSGKVFKFHFRKMI